MFLKKNKKNPHLRLLITLTFSKIALRIRDAGVAQLVEQLTCNQPVGGSTPLASSISKAKLLNLLAIVDIGRVGQQNTRPFWFCIF